MLYPLSYSRNAHRILEMAAGRKSADLTTRKRVPTATAATPLHCDGEGPGVRSNFSGGRDYFTITVPVMELWRRQKYA
jgi:hypothetical protein